jgi:hypothetical protein
MRIAGWLLLIVGTLLCVSIVWATIGFLMMGFGLICLLIAEKRTKRAAPLAKPPGKPREPRFQPVENRPAPAPLPKPGATGAARAAVVASEIARIRRDHASYDAEKWDALVGSDPDIARLVEAMVPYGRQYVDELAAVYLALNDKNYLPVIVDEIVASARRSAGQNRADDVTVGASDASGGARSKNSGLRPSRSGDLLRAASVSREPVAIAPVAVVPDTKPESIETPADNSSADVDIAVAIAATREPEPAKIAAEPILTVAPSAVPGAEAVGKTALDDAEDLRDLFKKLGS